MSSNVIEDKKPDPPCHVLIRTPLSECLIFDLLTVMFLAHAWELWFPKLPLLRKIVGRAYLLRFKHSVLKSDRTAYLIPWPGPHVIYLMSTFNEPDPIDTPSSPVRWPLSEMVRSWCRIENENIQKLFEDYHLRWLNFMFQLNPSSLHESHQCWDYEGVSLPLWYLSRHFCIRQIGNETVDWSKFSILWQSDWNSWRTLWPA